MPLVLDPVLLSDLPKVHHLSLTADQHSPTAEVLFPNHASETTIAHLVKQDEKDMQDFKSTTRHVMVRDVPDGGAGEGEGQVVSYATWNFFVGRKRSEGGGEEKSEDAYDEEWPSDVNRDAIKVLFANGKRKREEIMGGRDYALLANLCTAPTHRHMGSASLLMSWGLSLADSHYLRTYVEATPGALSLYLKHGFEKVSTLSIDLRPWDSPHIITHTILIRPAKPPSPLIDTIAISPTLTNADFLALPAIEESAFAAPPKPSQDPPSQLFPLIMKAVPPSTTASSRSTTLLHNALTDRTARYIKAFIPRNNAILGWAKWNFLLSPSDRVQEDPWPEGANTALVDAFFGRMERAQEEYMRGKRYLFMHVLVVLPEWQGRGVGRRMLEWGVEVADGEGVECWLDASKAGLGLYKRLGWREVGETSIELEEWGGEKGERETVVQMVRKVGGVVDD